MSSPLSLAFLSLCSGYLLTKKSDVSWSQSMKYDPHEISRLEIFFWKDIGYFTELQRKLRNRRASLAGHQAILLLVGCFNTQPH